MIQPWKKLGQKLDYDCGYFQVHIRRSASPVTGKEHPFYILSTPHWANIIAVTREKKVLFVSQYRHGTEEICLEIPGGAVDKKDGDPEVAARRELLEETGYEAGEWHCIGQIQPNPAILDNTCFIYLALDARPVASLKLDEAEELEVSFYDLEKVPGMIREGKMKHALVIAAFHFLELFRQDHPGKV